MTRRRVPLVLAAVVGVLAIVLAKVTLEPELPPEDARAPENAAG